MESRWRSWAWPQWEMFWEHGISGGIEYFHAFGWTGNITRNSLFCVFRHSFSLFWLKTQSKAHTTEKENIRTFLNCKCGAFQLKARKVKCLGHFLFWQTDLIIFSCKPGPNEQLVYSCRRTMSCRFPVPFRLLEADCKFQLAWQKNPSTWNPRMVLSYSHWGTSSSEIDLAVWHNLGVSEIGWNWSWKWAFEETWILTDLLHCLLIWCCNFFLLFSAVIYFDCRQLIFGLAVLFCMFDFLLLHHLEY